MSKCLELARLKADVEDALGNLAQAATLQLELFRSGKLDEWEIVDKKLERCVVETEQRVGALRQHIKEHDCLPRNLFPRTSDSKSSIQDKAEKS
jgi:hypothetical protein